MPLEEPEDEELYTLQSSAGIDHVRIPCELLGRITGMWASDSTNTEKLFLVHKQAGTPDRGLQDVRVRILVAS